MWCWYKCVLPVAFITLRIHTLSPPKEAQVARYREEHALLRGAFGAQKAVAKMISMTLKEVRPLYSFLRFRGRVSVCVCARAITSVYGKRKLGGYRCTRDELQ